MEFLYGDSTPSPLTSNFLEFLRDALDFAVFALHLDDEIAAIHERTRETTRAAEEEIQRLETLGRVVTGAVEGVDKGGAESETTRCSAQITTLSAEAVAAAIAAVRERLEGKRAELAAEEAGQRDACFKALEKLLLPHSPPGVGYGSASRARPRPRILRLASGRNAVRPELPHRARYPLGSRVRQRRSDGSARRARRDPRPGAGGVDQERGEAQGPAARSTGAHRGGGRRAYRHAAPPYRCGERARARSRRGLEGEHRRGDARGRPGGSLRGHVRAAAGRRFGARRRRREGARRRRGAHRDAAGGSDARRQGREGHVAVRRLRRAVGGAHGAHRARRLASLAQHDGARPAASTLEREARGDLRGEGDAAREVHGPASGAARHLHAPRLLDTLPPPARRSAAPSAPPTPEEHDWPSRSEIKRSDPPPKPSRPPPAEEEPST